MKQAKNQGKKLRMVVMHMKKNWLMIKLLKEVKKAKKVKCILMDLVMN
jgi:hypothetical protein